MRFLHTSDWHVGRTIRNRSRADEHEAVFDEIVDIAKQEDVDAVLVTGDIFHERRPPLEAEELTAYTFAELARERIPVVVIPGNHDDPARLRTLKPLGDLVQVHIIADFGPDPAALVVPIPAQDGKETALIGCVPYLHPHQVLTSAEGANVTEDIRVAQYQGTVQKIFGSLSHYLQQRDRSAISIVLAHAHIDTCEFGGGEWRSSVFPFNARSLPEHVHYVALGHLHKPQAVDGAKSQAWYAGSILQMDFGERDQQKSVCVIDARPGKPATVSQIPLRKGKTLLRRTGTAEAILAQARDFADAWVEVVLQPDKRTVELVDQVRALPGVIAVRFAEAPGSSGTHSSNGNGGVARPQRPPTELFSDYYRSKRKADPAPELVALFDRLYQEASTASDEG